MYSIGVKNMKIYQKHPKDKNDKYETRFDVNNFFII